MFYKKNYSLKILCITGFNFCIISLISTSCFRHSSRCSDIYASPKLLRPFILALSWLKVWTQSWSRGSLTGSKIFPARYSNTCWSLVSTNDGIKVGASYKGGAEKIDVTSKFVSKTGESAELRKATYEESIGWYEGITSDMFS